ncbi:Transposase [Cohnella sp. OV330]|uniref:transposase n=1 Tax=Cohnella sp. OV330 TaxID=1855288 RepID=UPI0008E36BE7|nr:transposase [Cohnella sp. OV330]SFB22306.1 Transposase [Cohnella sp. OV330]
MKRRFYGTEALKKEYVGLVVSGYRTEHVARQHGLSPSTLSRWVRQYWDEVEAELTKKMEHAEQLAKDSKDLQKKYDQAMKMLGEKELEIAILKDLLKKRHLARLPTRSRLLLDEARLPRSESLEAL